MPESSNLTSDPQQPQIPHDIRPLLPYTWGWFEYSLLALGILIAVLLLWGLWRWNQKRLARMAPMLPSRTLPEILRDRWAALKLSPDMTAKQYKEFYLELSMILREFLEYQFKLRSTDMTTQEILRYLPMYLPQQFAQKEAMAKFFRRVEEISFAGRHADPDDAKSWHKAVGIWLEELTPKPLEAADGKLDRAMAGEVTST